ncbi:MAG: hypothetical protein HWD61_13730 [Parachlamydiaceae bacterium]|nr:MAG: hypothetical protein HWD61_13730 [Parachlamydiaceae bacterium]
MEKLPLDGAQMIGVRGNGDCTMRSIGVGLIIEALRDQGIESLKSDLQAVHHTLLDAAKETKDMRFQKYCGNLKRPLWLYLCDWSRLYNKLILVL